MLASEPDGVIRRGRTASRVQGVPIAAVVADPAFARLVVVDASGSERTLPAEEAEGALLAVLRGATTLVLPSRARNQWIVDVVTLRTE